jgi:hypothetical protein
MAGTGYKLFATGDVLTAAQVNTYLNEQTVMVFADSAARTTALSGVLAEGMVSYLQDTNAVEVYNGSAWVGVSGAGDVTEVQAGTGISVASGTGPIPVVTNTMATAIDAEGDLIIGDAADAFQRLAIGSNTHVLTVDTSVDGKIKWAAPAASGFVGCSLTNTTDQTTANDTSFTLAFNTERFDTDGFHDNSVNNSRITIPSGKGGKYLINAQVTFKGNATGIRRIRMVTNGACCYDNADDLRNATSAGDCNLAFTWLRDFSVGDYIRLDVLQTSGGSLDVGGSSAGYALQFSAIYLGA